VSDALVITLVTGLCLVPVGLAAGLSATRLWLGLATLAGLAWLGASGFYFYVYLELGGEETWPLAALLALWCVAIAGLVARRLAALAGGVRPSSALGGGHDAAAAGAAAARDPKA
jgi:hypothetical protein